MNSKNPPNGILVLLMIFIALAMTWLIVHQVTRPGFIYCEYGHPCPAATMTVEARLK